MTPETSAQIDAFRAWLLRQGYETLPVKSQWELLRWLSPAGDGVRIIHTNKRGVVSGFGCDRSKEDWQRWQDLLVEDVPTATVHRLPTKAAALRARPNPEPVHLTSVGPAGAVGDYQVQRYTTDSYVGADIHDKDGRWIANIHGTTGRKNKPVPDYENHIRRFCNAEKMEALLQEFSGRAPFMQVDLDWLSQLAVEAKKILQGEQ